MAWWKYVSWPWLYNGGTTIHGLDDQSGLQNLIDPSVQGSIAQQTANQLQKVQGLAALVPSGTTPKALHTSIAAYGGQQSTCPSATNQWTSPALTSDTVFTLEVHVIATGGAPLAQALTDGFAVVYIHPSCWFGHSSYAYGCVYTAGQWFEAQGGNVGRLTLGGVDVGDQEVQVGVLGVVRPARALIAVDPLEGQLGGAT